MYCQKCGSQIPDDARFCPNCASQIVTNQPVYVQYVNIDKNPEEIKKYKNRCIRGIISSIIAFIGFLAVMFSAYGPLDASGGFVFLTMIAAAVSGFALFENTIFVYFFPINIVVAIMCGWVGAPFIFTYFLVKYKKFKKEYPEI